MNTRGRPKRGTRRSIECPRCYRWKPRGACLCDVCSGLRLAHETLINPSTPWDEDAACQYVVACHPDGLTLAQVGDLLGVTRERVRQIEEKALRRLVLRCRLAGLDLEPIVHVGIPLAMEDS